MCKKYTTAAPPVLDSDLFLMFWPKHLLLLSCASDFEAQLILQYGLQMKGPLSSIPFLAFASGLITIFVPYLHSIGHDTNYFQCSISGVNILDFLCLYIVDWTFTDLVHT